MPLYRAYPFQVIESDQDVILKRGLTELLVKGDQALSTILIILSETSGTTSTKEDLLQKFPEFRRPQVGVFIDQLVEKRFLLDNDHISDIDIQKETNADVFYWQLGKRPNDLLNLFDNHRIGLAGVNKLSIKICECLKTAGFKNIDFVEYFPVEAKNVIGVKSIITQLTLDEWKKNCLDTNSNIIIGCSEFGGQVLLLELNQWCVENNIAFIPVVMDQMKGQVGPLVMPGITACLACLRARQNAHLYKPDLERYTEQYAIDGGTVAAVHPSILNTTAELAAFELIKAFGHLKPEYKASFIEVDLINGRVESSQVLRLPRCPICSIYRKHTRIKTVLTKP